jgi:hypothetical protein
MDPQRTFEMTERNQQSGEKPLSFASSPNSKTAPTSLEVAARAALDQRAEHALTDTEWAQALASLLEFAIILRAWKQKANTIGFELDKVA